MLQLITNKYKNTYSNQYYYGQTPERLGFGDSGNIRLQNHTYYFRSPSSIRHADLPLHMNRIPFVRKYFCFDETAEGNREEVMNGIKNKLLNLFNETSDVQYTIITGYLAGDTLENDEYEYAFIDKDIWKEFKDTLLSYNPLDWDDMNFNYVYSEEDGVRLYKDFAEISRIYKNKFDAVLKASKIRRLETQLSKLKGEQSNENT